MEKKMLVKAMSVAAVAMTLAACGSDDSSSNSGSQSFSSNLSANPNFQFEQTNYVGAFEDASDDWADFALQGSLPTATDLSEFNSDLSDVDAALVQDLTNVTPVAATDGNDCPASAQSQLLVSETGNTVTRDGKTFLECELTGRIDQDITLSNTVVWKLNGMVKVGNGDKTLSSQDNVVTNPVLTIEAGTMLRSGSGSSLVVTRGAEINAVGTATQPIIMMGDAGNLNDRGQWGGLVLQGYAYNNKCDAAPGDAAYCNMVGEGATGNLGGYDNSDSSGTLQYVVVANAGNEISTGNELNGVSFQGVGYGTTVDHIQVHQNDDDGVEFFGGAVDVEYLVLTSNKDDDIDWDEGYVGNIQHALIVKTTSKDNSRHAFELDTKGDNVESAYLESNPTVANVTALSLLGASETAAAGDGIHLKEGSEGRFFNVAMLGNFRNCVYIKDDTNYTTAANAIESFNGVAVGGCQSDTNTLPTGFDITIDSDGVALAAGLVVTGATAASGTIESEQVTAN